jgi:hypothetical protein
MDRCQLYRMQCNWQTSLVFVPNFYILMWQFCPNISAMPSTTLNLLFWVSSKPRHLHYDVISTAAIVSALSMILRKWFSQFQKPRGSPTENIIDSVTILYGLQEFSGNKDIANGFVNVIKNSAKWKDTRNKFNPWGSDSGDK